MGKEKMEPEVREAVESAFRRLGLDEKRVRHAVAGFAGESDDDFVTKDGRILYRRPNVFGVPDLVEVAAGAAEWLRHEGSYVMEGAGKARPVTDRDIGLGILKQFGHSAGLGPQKTDEDPKKEAPMSDHDLGTAIIKLFAGG